MVQTLAMSILYCLQNLGTYFLANLSMPSYFPCLAFYKYFLFSSFICLLSFTPQNLYYPFYMFIIPWHIILQYLFWNNHFGIRIFFCLFLFTYCFAYPFCFIYFGTTLPFLLTTFRRHKLSFQRRGHFLCITIYRQQA